MDIIGRDPTRTEDEEIQAQVQIWKHMYGFADTMMLRCALLLGIPDIIHKQGPMALAQLASELPLSSIDIDRFHHVMRYLVHMELFTTTTDKTSGDTIYGPTAASGLLMKEDENSLRPYAMLQTDPEAFTMWNHIVESLDGSKNYWVSTYETSLYAKIENEPAHKNMVNEAMASHTRSMVQALVSGLVKEQILDGVGSIVDVGGNTGTAAKAIKDEFPHLKCIVMDLIHIIDSVVHDPYLDFVPGDMFASVPFADAVLVKSVLHNYEDDDCLKILIKCKEAIPSAGGKLILVEIVLDTENLPELAFARLGMDMEMICMGGKERTKQEWADILHKAGYSHHKIIPIMAIESIIVAYP